jgi:hypothetical protein
VAANGQHGELGRRALRGRADRGDLERLLERAGDHAVHHADPHPDGGHPPLAGPPQDRLEDALAVAELVHYIDLMWR